MAKSPSRNRLISLIHVAKKELALTEDSHRALLIGATEKDSLREMSVKELEAVIEVYKKHGFKKKKPKRAGTRKLATGTHARLIRALWISLYQLGEVRDPSEEAMAKYVKRMGGVDSLEFLTARQSNAVISGLREWMKRAGYVRPSPASFDVLREFAGTDTDFNAETFLNAAHVLMAQAKIAFPKYQRYSEWLSEKGVKSEHPYSMSLEEIYDLTEKLGVLVRETKRRNNGTI